MRARFWIRCPSLSLLWQEVYAKNKDMAIKVKIAQLNWSARMLQMSPKAWSKDDFEVIKQHPVIRGVTKDLQILPDSEVTDIVVIELTAVSRELRLFWVRITGISVWWRRCWATSAEEAIKLMRLRQQVEERYKDYGPRLREDSKVQVLEGYMEFTFNYTDVLIELKERSLSPGSESNA